MDREQELSMIKALNADKFNSFDQVVNDFKAKLEKTSSDLQKRDQELKEQIDQNLASSSQFKKNIALLQQRQELNQRSIDDLKNQLSIKNEQNLEKSKYIKELQNLVAELKKEHKQANARTTMPAKISVDL
jgi:chromosome segregation ATPase